MYVYVRDLVCEYVCEKTRERLCVCLCVCVSLCVENRIMNCTSSPLDGKYKKDTEDTERHRSKGRRQGRNVRDTVRFVLFYFSLCLD